MNSRRTEFGRAPGAGGISKEMVPLSARAALAEAPVVARLVAGVAHEVNDPATYVGANLGILAEHVQSFQRAVQDIEQLLADDPQRLAAMRAVVEARDLGHALSDAEAIVAENLQGLHRLSDLVQELRSFTHIDAADLSYVHPNEVVNTACARVHGLARGRARVVQDLGDVPSLAADRWRLQQAVIQLLLNALDAVADDAAEAPMVVVSTRASGAHVVISVADPGEGIRAEHLPHVFEPFFTTRPGHRGLGLTVAAGAARDHGGDLRVYSQEGEGARFDLVLPRETGLKVPDRR
jgi:two-component system NtrC family sensor kinase